MEIHIKTGYVLMSWCKCYDQKLEGTQSYISYRSNGSAFANSVHSDYIEHNYYK